MAATPSEFEEKEFEAPLYDQLQIGNRLLWSPGQVFEGYVGFDRALFLNDPDLWRFFGVNAVPRGVFLHRFDWEYIWRQRQRRRQMPNFRLNLFIQAKRCFYHRNRPRHLRSQMARSPCWRFDLNPNQHDAIGKVSAKLGDRAAVVYAAPAFHRLTTLYAHTARGSIVAHTTFPRAAALNGHGAWYYTGPGGSGFANPEAERIDGPELEQLLNGMVANQSSDREGSPSEQLATLSREIVRAVQTEVSDDNPRKVLFFEALRQSEAALGEYTNVPGVARPFLNVTAFSKVFNLDWYVVG